MVANVSDTTWEGDCEECTDPCLQPIKTLDIQTFGARVMKSTAMPTLITEGPLHGDQLLLSRTFALSNGHSNTTPEELSEVWSVLVEQDRMTLEATTQHHLCSASMHAAVL